MGNLACYGVRRSKGLALEGDMSQPFGRCVIASGDVCPYRWSPDPTAYCPEDIRENLAHSCLSKSSFTCAGGLPAGVGWNRASSNRTGCKPMPQRYYPQARQVVPDPTESHALPMRNAS